MQKTNDPRDLEPPQLGAGLNSHPELEAFHTPGPYVPSENLMKNVEEPKVSRCAPSASGVMLTGLCT